MTPTAFVAAMAMIPFRLATAFRTAATAAAPLLPGRLMPDVVFDNRLAGHSHSCGVR